MVRLKKKIHPHFKTASYNVAVQINNEVEELCEITFTSTNRLRVLLMEFNHKSPLLLYLKDTTVINIQSVDSVTLKHDLINGVDLFMIRFASLGDKENFIRDGFFDRLGDSGLSSVSDSSSTPPQINN